MRGPSAVLSPASPRPRCSPPPWPSRPPDSSARSARPSLLYRRLAGQRRRCAPGWGWPTPGLRRCCSAAARVWARSRRLRDAVARRLAATGTDAQLVVICGRNERLRQALQRSATDWPIPVQVCGFVDNMQEWMAASDCVISKAGPGTIAEALICGLPILVSGFIPGQEAGNVSYRGGERRRRLLMIHPTASPPSSATGPAAINWPRCPPAPASSPVPAPPMTLSMRSWSLWMRKSQRQEIVDRGP